MEQQKEVKVEHGLIEYEIEQKKQNLERKEKKQRKKLSRKDKKPTRYESWQGKQIKKLFYLYQEYGSKWNLISQELPSRNQNSVKNRFYTSLRHLLKVIYRSPASSKKFPGQIDSKHLHDFYHGKNEFKKLKNYALKLLERMNFQENSKIALDLWSQFELELKDLHLAICKIKERNKKGNTEQYVKIQEPSPDYEGCL